MSRDQATNAGGATVCWQDPATNPMKKHTCQPGGEAQDGTGFRTASLRTEKRDSGRQANKETFGS